MNTATPDPSTSTPAKSADKPCPWYLRRRGITIEPLFISMIFFGLLVALIGPYLFGHVDAAKIKITKQQISAFKAPLDAYRQDFGRYPTSEEGLKVLWEKPVNAANAVQWRGPYLPKPVTHDGWENPYVYKSPDNHGAYDLLSYGRDGMEGGEGDDADLSNR